MKPRFASLACAVVVAASAFAVRAEQLPPRDIWPQASAAAREGDVDSASKKTSELVDTGRAFGIKRFPVYAGAAAGFARQSEAEGKKDVSGWADTAAAQLDPKSSGVAFSTADAAAAKNDWPGALPSVARGLLLVLTNYRTSVLGRADLLIVLSVAIALTAIIFAIALFIRYGRSMAHDFREALGRRIHGGSVSVLAFALLFLPIFVWLGPMWLVFYWFAIFFGYANASERTLIIVIGLLVAALPLTVDFAGTAAAAIDGPVMQSAVASAEQSYQPEALRRVQELANVVPDDSTLQILLGNMYAFEGNDTQAGDHYRRAIAIGDAAGAHVNLGNLHFLQNDYGAASTEYTAAQKRDSQMAIAFYNDSLANGALSRFEEQGQLFDKAKRLDKDTIEQLSQNPPAQKVAMYHPRMMDAWRVAMAIASRGLARSQFGNYAYFDARTSAMNPVTLGALASVVLALVLWLVRRGGGFAGSCIKCGRTFCHRCKSARESATYCTQCIHIYLKRDGVALATKRAKLDEVSDHYTGMARRNRLFATFLPGSAQMLEGRTPAGIAGMLLFFFFVCVAVLVGRLAPAIGPVAQTAQLAVRVASIALAVLTWVTTSLPVYRRRVTPA
ncbi:MAG TPA: tetratricopeptide repeat protein [Thermoanaerobaculia bacterium]|nr:tetratricopeptide repeat protein [Thermoanaerobaculia bacterium]